MAASLSSTASSCSITIELRRVDHRSPIVPPAPAEEGELGNARAVSATAAASLRGGRNVTRRRVLLLELLLLALLLGRLPLYRDAASASSPPCGRCRSLRCRSWSTTSQQSDSACMRAREQSTKSSPSRCAWMTFPRHLAIMWLKLRVSRLPEKLSTMKRCSSVAQRRLRATRTRKSSLHRHRRSHE